MEKIQFWNGNKSSIRANYEVDVLQACIAATQDKYGPANIIIDNTDHPAAIDESNVFQHGADALVTVLANPKFAHREKIIIEKVIDKGMLGYRAILCCRTKASRLATCKNKTDLRSFSIGIPDTWVDADLFRANEFNVVEEGSLDDLFIRLQQGRFDWTSLGMNEVNTILNQFESVDHSADENVMVVPGLMIYCPLLLVFYVTPDKPELADRISSGMDMIRKNGELNRIFQQHYGDIVKALALHDRDVISVINPDIEGPLVHYQPELLQANNN